MFGFKKIYRNLLIFMMSAAMIFSTTLTVHAADAETVLNDEEWNKYIEESLSLDKTPGLSLVTVQNSEVHFKNWGYSNIADKTPLTEDTVLQIGV